MEETGPRAGPFARHQHLRRVETCDCDGEDGFEYRPVGCGPAAEFSTCLPQACEQFVARCARAEVCVPGGLDQAPACRACEDDLVPSSDRQACVHPDCAEDPPECGAGLECGAGGSCVPCPEGQVVDAAHRRCRACPGGFVARNGRCEPLFGRGYLVTRLQVLPESPPDVVGRLNAQDGFRALWDAASEDGYNMIWDQDLLLVFFFPEYPDGSPPPQADSAALYVYESAFGYSELWENHRDEVEPELFRDPTRPGTRDGWRANYLPAEPSGRACVTAPGSDCNPAYFGGDGLMVEKTQTTDACSPTLARLRVRYGPDRIETVAPSWLLLPYAKYGFLFQAQDVDIRLVRRVTGLCDEGAGSDWPCSGYEGWVRGVIRAVELLDSIRTYTGGGIGDNLIEAMLGDPDTDLDGDGAADGYTLQFDVDLTPIVYAASLEAAGR